MLVDIPIDILFTPIDLDTVDWGGGNKLAAAPAPARQAVADALRLLSEAERPAIIAGEGALHHGELVREFIERSGIPLFTQWGMHDLVPFDHPLYGYHVRGLAFGKFKEIGIPDVVLVLGARIGMSEDFRNQNVVPATAALIHVYEDPAEIGRLIPAEVGITASVPETLAAFLADDVAWPDRSGWASAIVGAHRFRRPAADGPTEVDGRLHPFHVAKTVLEALPPGTHIVGDGSDCLHWLDDAIYYGNPGSSTGYGGYFCQLGTGFGFAVGRQLAFPDQRIVLVTGDGAFGIHPAEIDTMVRFELPIVVVLFNNAAWGSSTQGQLLYYGENGVVGSRLADSAYDKVAEGFGAYGERVDSLEDLAPALQRAFDSGLPAVINVAVADVEDSLAAPLLNWTDDPDTLVIPYYDNVRRREWYRPGRYRATSGQSVGHDATIAI